MQTFRDYMESVLYDGETGYYAVHRRVGEDFYTAPEVHGCFGSILADDFARRLGRLEAAGVSGPYALVEMGTGDGRLAATVLARLASRHARLAETVAYRVVERSSKFREQAKAALASFPNVTFHESLADVPAGPGVFYSNELVDAFPFHLLEKRGGKVYEVFVETRTDGQGVRVGWEGPSNPELAARAERLAAGMDEGTRRAVVLEAGRWLRDVSERLTAGWLVTIDYGHRYAEGAAAAPKVFYRHRLEDFPARPGKEDITASVDFEGLIREGEQSGLAFDTYETMARFLVDRGVLDWLPAGQTVQNQLERAKIKNLFHPEGMGEAYKVLVQRKGPGTAA